MSKEQLIDVQDLAGDMRLNTEALKALATVFGDAFCTDADPERMAQNIRNRPEVFTHLWYLLFDLICRIRETAGAVETGLGE